MGRALKAGRKVYWVCPLVAESEQALDLAAAEERHAALKDALRRTGGSRCTAA